MKVANTKRKHSISARSVLVANTPLTMLESPPLASRIRQSLKVLDQVVPEVAFFQSCPDVI